MATAGLAIGGALILGPILRGGAFQQNTAKETISVVNKMFQASSETCISNCSNITSGQTTIISGTTIGGNLDLTQQCSATASCVMNQQFDAQVKNLLKSVSLQHNTSKDGWLTPPWDSQSNNTQITENTKNYYTQIMSSACSANSSNLSENEMTVLTNDKIGGNFFLGQKGSSISNCTMNNIGRAVAYNKDIAKVSQSNLAESSLAMILAIIVILIVMVVIFHLFAQKKNKKGKNEAGGFKIPPQLAEDFAV